MKLTCQPTCPLSDATRPPYCSLGGGSTLPRTSIMLLLMVRPNSCTYASLLKSARRTKLLISLSRSGADLKSSNLRLIVIMHYKSRLLTWRQLLSWLKSACRSVSLYTVGQRRYCKLLAVSKCVCVLVQPKHKQMFCFSIFLNVV